MFEPGIVGEQARQNRGVVGGVQGITAECGVGGVNQKRQYLGVDTAVSFASREGEHRIAHFYQGSNLWP